MPCPSHPPWLDHSNYVWWGSLSHIFLLCGQFPGFDGPYNSVSSPLHITRTAAIGNNATNGNEIRVEGNELRTDGHCSVCQMLLSHVVSKGWRWGSTRQNCCQLLQKCMKRDLLVSEPLKTYRAFKEKQFPQRRPK
jgi:hypothetical protein